MAKSRIETALIAQFGVAIALTPLASVRAEAAGPTLYHAQNATYGCATPHAIRTLLSPPEARQSDQVWFRYIFDQGHCVSISTRSPWKLEYISGDLAWMSYAGTVGAPGSFYFATSVMVDDQGRHPSLLTGPPTQLLPNVQAARPPARPEVAPQAIPQVPQKVVPAPTLPAPQSPPANFMPPPSQAASTDSGSGSGVWVWVIGIIAFIIWLFRSQGRTKGKAKPGNSPLRPGPLTTANNTTPATTSVRTGPPARQSTATASTKINATWYLPGKAAVIHDTVVNDGMVYVGTALMNSSGVIVHAHDNCLINPSLPVAAGRPSAMPYWPSYANISPQNRNALLTWLGSGKSDPAIDIGYVFLYFYGIERRLIGERPSKDEALLLMAEVRRLLSIYGANGSFHGYASRLLTTAQFLYDPGTTTSDPDPLVDDFTLERQATLAEFCRDGKPISFAWAALWHKEQMVGNPVWRKCPPDYLALARQQFEAAHPNGLIAKPINGPPFQCAYQPANRSIVPNFDDVIKARYGDKLPSLNRGAPSEVTDYFKKAASRLKRYAEFVETHPGAEESPLALARLPTELRGLRLPAAEAALKDWIDGLIATAKGVVLLDHLWSRLYGRSAWLCDKSSWEELAKQLQKYRYGLIPDPLFNDIPHLRPDQSVVLFPLENDKSARTAPQPDFVTGQAIAFVSADFARHSGMELPPASLKRLSDALTSLGLSGAEQTRILRSMPWYETQGLIRGRLKKTLDHLVPPRRLTVLAAAAGVLNASTAEPGQLVAFLEKICAVLDVDRNELYSALHQTAAGPVPVAVANVIDIRTGYAIPKPPPSAARAAKGTALDPSRIKSVLADTEEAFDALSKVLVEEDTPTAAQSSASVSGLDALQSQLLARLLEKESWTRSEFEAITRGLGLMPDGALEALNEWAFDNFEEPLIDEGDPLLINASCVEALTVKNAAAARVQV